MLENNTSNKIMHNFMLRFTEIYNLKPTLESIMCSQSIFEFELG